MARKLTAAERLSMNRLQRARLERPRLLFAPPAWAVRPNADYPEQCPGFYVDGARRIAVVTANRCGKTTTAIRRMAQMAIDRPKTRWRIVGPTSKVTNTSHGAILFEAVKDQMDPKSTFREGTGFNRDNVCLLKNGSWIQIMNYKQDPQAHASNSLHGVLLDEPPPPPFFREAEKRVFDTGGFVWVTMTAVDRPVAWLKKAVLSGVDQGLWSYYQVGLSHENCPWYTESQIEEEKRRARLSPWSYAQTIDGAWEGVSADRMFTGYQPDRNLITLDVGHAKGWPWPAASTIKLVLIADHGEGKGHAHWLLMGYKRQLLRGRVVLCIRVLGEWSNPHRASVKSDVQGIRAMVREAGFDLVDIDYGVGDTNSAGKSETARSMNEDYEQAFALELGRHAGAKPFEMRPAHKGADSVKGHVAQVNQLLDETVDGVQALTVHESCVKLIEALSHWDGSTKTAPLKHAGDALRYGVDEIIRAEEYQPVRLVA